MLDVCSSYFLCPATTCKGDCTSYFFWDYGIVQTAESQLNRFRRIGES